MTDKPEAQDMLALHETDPEAFWKQVRSDAARVLVEKPWAHFPQPIGSTYYPRHCTKCGLEWADLYAWEDIYANKPCPVPPPITDPPEVLVRRLRDKVHMAGEEEEMAAFCNAISDVTLLTDNGEQLQWWLLAQPYEQITCLFVSLDLWRLQP